jgi:hypothetical protein
MDVIIFNVYVVINFVIIVRKNGLVKNVSVLRKNNTKNNNKCNNNRLKTLINCYRISCKQPKRNKDKIHERYHNIKYYQMYFIISFLEVDAQLQDLLILSISFEYAYVLLHIKVVYLGLIVILVRLLTLVSLLHLIFLQDLLIHLFHQIHFLNSFLDLVKQIKTLLD